MRDTNIDNNMLKLSLKITTIVSIIITIINRLNIDDYSKLVVLPITIILLGYTIFMNLLKEKINLKSYIFLLLIIIVLLSYYIIPLAPVNRVLNIIVIGILTSIYVYILINPNYKLDFKIFRWLIKLFPGRLFSNLEYVGPSIKSTKMGNSKNKLIIKGILITIPIVIIIIALLTNADAYFKMFITKILSTFKIDLSFESLISIARVLVISFVLVFSTIINIYQTRKIELAERKKYLIENTI